MVHRILNNRAPSHLTNYFTKLEDVHTYNTRAKATNLKLYKFKAMMSEVSFKYTAAIERNELPLQIKE